jgi:transcription initiation factor IIE alpha subunit
MNLCRCEKPKPVRNSVGGKVCSKCGKSLRENEPNGDIIPDVSKRIRDLERNMRQFQLELQQLKAQVRAD